MKAMKVMKAMKKKAMKVSKIAKGKRARASVFNGTKEKTGSGMTKAKLMKNKNGRIVSKASSAPPRTRRRPLLRSPLLRTRPRRRPRRQQRTLPRPDPAGLAASDKYFAVEFLWQFIQ